MKSLGSILLFSSLLTIPSFSQEKPLTKLEIDLNGDGQKEFVKVDTSAVPRPILSIKDGKTGKEKTYGYFANFSHLGVGKENGKNYILFFTGRRNEKGEYERFKLMYDDSGEYFPEHGYDKIN